jgi:putative DNA primase/helicase
MTNLSLNAPYPDEIEQEIEEISFKDMKLIVFPKKEFLLWPWLQKASPHMIFAPSGIGKTYFAMAIALSVASGQPLIGNKWLVPEPRRVLYVDGEMNGRAMTERIMGFKEANNLSDVMDENLSILTPDLCKRDMPDLGNLDGRKRIEAILVRKKIDLVIIDNLSTLYTNLKSENDAESVNDFNDWIKRLTRMGIAIEVVHHAGKDPLKQRGTSKFEVLFHTIKRLSRPQGYRATDRARFNVNFTKTRDICEKGIELCEFETQLVNYKFKLLSTEQATEEIRELREMCEDRENTLDERIRLYAAQNPGETYQSIATKFDTYKMKVSRALNVE